MKQDWKISVIFHAQQRTHMGSLYCCFFSYMFRVFHSESDNRVIKRFCFLQTAEPKVSVQATNTVQ